MLCLSCCSCCLSPLNRFLAKLLCYILLYLCGRWVRKFWGWWCDFWWVRWEGDFWMIGLWEMLDFCGWNGVGGSVLFWVICIDFLKILIVFDWSLIFQGMRGVLKAFLMIFSDVKMAENIDFSRFCRTRYRTQNGGRGMKTSDMPFLAIEHLF